MSHNVIPTVGVLVIKDDKVLLVKHTDGAGHLNDKYGLPAGRINDGESEAEAARRELEEETGFKIKVGSLTELPHEWHASIVRKDGVKEFSLRVFAANNLTGELKNSEETTPEWVEIKNLSQYDLLPNVEDVVQKGMEFLIK